MKKSKEKFESIPINYLGSAFRKAPVRDHLISHAQIVLLNVCVNGISSHISEILLSCTNLHSSLILPKNTEF